MRMLTCFANWNLRFVVKKRVIDCFDFHLLEIFLKFLGLKFIYMKNSEYKINMLFKWNM